MVDADVRRELRIFYSLRLEASFYKTAAGEILPNAQGVPDYGKDGGKWSGGAQNSMRDSFGHFVGVGASIARVKTVTPAGGAPSTSYEHVDDSDPTLGAFGRELKKWTGQPWPRAYRGEPCKMLSIPYGEPAAKLFCDVLRGLASLADVLETNLSDAEALPALLASGSLPLLLGRS